ncbi:MAG TPA: hypothetical protein DCM05_10140 [Elusimicrobia bacterium]|nr:hypothetical protein [Elusimicrobiota bacterium]
MTLNDRIPVHGEERPLKALFEDLRQLFGPRRTPLESLRIPEFHVQETPKEVLVFATLPGMSKKDILVSVTGNILTVRGVQRKGRAYGSFVRVFTLAAPVRAEQGQARFRNHVLQVVLPRLKAAEAKA